ncbi:forespore regulator of the sigma-K checkpoint [Cytobacillus firmus]|uniref:Forespore regulator of the sigma-K checkpoint n=2 Tax=Cytobacillus TaxID=2675230 RepID=A0A366K0C6_CYTFI|nr:MULTISPECIES: intercompartmental signaling factor BofC [Cytobacillus]RBP94001.1 forespore regulator of the sigma-K checkpoint [Cytobacillus firmus]TDX47585.1 forespore regulator of the sigma-K checkpoint [Cytobacillus oceanisediminis]
MRTIWSLLLIGAASFYPFFQKDAFNFLSEGTSVYAEAAEKHIEGPLKMDVILEREYLDGEVSQETIEETIWTLEDFWAKYDQWQLVDMDIDYMVFRRKMDDISPLLKANGYFGVTEDGTLTIFNGRPQETNIIQSFFQIDLGRLESTKCEELKKGIPIVTKDRYVEVLETFKSYTAGEKQAN